MSLDSVDKGLRVEVCIILVPNVQGDLSSRISPKLPYLPGDYLDLINVPMKFNVFSGGCQFDNYQMSLNKCLAGV